MTSAATSFQKLAGTEPPRRTEAMSLMMYCATLAIAMGRTATMMRRMMPQETTAGPESHRILSTGGMLRRARRRSLHGPDSLT